MSLDALVCPFLLRFDIVRQALANLLFSMCQHHPLPRFICVFACINWQTRSVALHRKFWILSLLFDGAVGTVLVHL